MSKTIYYIGAGASFGKRDKNGLILEGVPVVTEIPREFNTFRDFIANAQIPTTGEFSFQSIYLKSALEFDSTKRDILRDLDSLIIGIQEHATIDTYARKLYLTGKQRDFSKLKGLLCAFFVWTQLQYKPDGRYDAFLANILEEGSLSLPKDISIISWNYDSQIETVYKAYNPKIKLPIFEKNLQGNWPSLPDEGRIFKINGTASFVDSPIVSLIRDDEKNMPVALQLMEFYYNTKVDTSELGIDFKTHVSFAWEGSNNKEKMMNSLSATIVDTEQVVVIGYSFPYFNREMDRAILRGMPRLETVYIQDKNIPAVKQAVEAVLPVDKEVKVIPIENCNQFFLPRDL